MNDEQKGLVIKDMKYIKEVMEKVEKKKPQPIFWGLWGVITVVAGIIMQILYFKDIPEYSGIIWGILGPIGTIISFIIGYKYYKDEPNPLKDPTLKYRPFILLVWVCMITLGLVMTYFLIKTKTFELIITLWFLVTGVTLVQTGNIFRSYYWPSKTFYFFGTLLVIFGILVSLVSSLQIWTPIIWHLLFGLCWLAEGIRGRKQNGKWI